MSYAVISPCRRFRYTLTREWDDDKPSVTFIMLNPSTADADQDDPTIRRCIGFAKSWGYGSLTVVNLFAWRATDPRQLVTMDRIGPDNDDWIRRMCATHGTQLVVCAWGIHGALFDRGESVRGVLCFRDVHHLGLTKGGHPRHPLYLKGDTTPIPWPWDTPPDDRARRKEKL